jgi:hypothetical protein
MRGANAFEIGNCALSSEILFRVYNRKLCAVLLNAGIELGELENEVIQSTPQVIANLPYQNADAQGGWHVEGADQQETVRGIRLEFDANGSFVLPERLGQTLPQIDKVFLCPRYSFERAIEYMRER